MTIKKLVLHLFQMFWIWTFKYFLSNIYVDVSPNIMSSGLELD